MATQEPGKPERITVSRDALRADLAEMELRLRVWMGEQLVMKADHASVAILQDEMAQLQQDRDAGVFTDGQVRRLNEIHSQHDKILSDRSWTTGQRWIAVIMTLITVGSFALSVILLSTPAR